MAAKWQRWMPMEIDALKASPSVQAMHPSARSGYVWLLLDAWQTDDCTIPTDPIDLADKSGLGDELWGIYGLRILRKFERVDGSDRLRNLPQYERWQAAKSIYEKRQEAAHRKNEIRSPSDKNTVTDTLTDRSPGNSRPLPLEPPLITETKTETKEQKQKPSAKKKPSRGDEEKVADTRHQECKKAIQEYWNSKNLEIEMPWDVSEGKALGMFLSANPKLTEVGVRRLLSHRANSEVNHGDRPSKWIRSLTSFNHGAIDKFGKPILLTNGHGANNAAISNGAGNAPLGVLEKTLARRQRQRTLDEDGDLSAGGENGRSDAGDIHATSGELGPPSIPSRDEEHFEF